jgi:phospholipase C
MATPILPQIKNIVFLMLENRSFDNLLGWLYTGTTPPRNFW